MTYIMQVCFTVPSCFFVVVVVFLCMCVCMSEREVSQELWPGQKRSDWYMVVFCCCFCCFVLVLQIIPFNTRDNSLQEPNGLNGKTLCRLWIQRNACLFTKRKCRAYLNPFAWNGLLRSAFSDSMVPCKFPQD